MTSSIVRLGISNRYVQGGFCKEAVLIYFLIFQKTRLDCKQNYEKLMCDKFDVLDMNKKSNELENEIAQLKINKSQKLESSSNVSVENMNEIKKMEDSVTDINAKLFGKFNPNRKKTCNAQEYRFYLVSMFP